MNRWEVINHYLSRFENPKYLEIGVHEGVNWQRIKADEKTGVDPFPKFRDNRIQTCTSDAFFDRNEKIFDVIFIDGLHEKETFLNDLFNSLSFLSYNGFILCHDCAPIKEEETRVPRPKSKGRWNGDVYLGWIKARTKLHLNTYTIDTDEGIGVVCNGIPDKPLELNDTLSWDSYRINKIKWLNLIGVESFKKMM